MPPGDWKEMSTDTRHPFSMIGVTNISMTIFWVGAHEKVKKMATITRAIRDPGRF